MTEEEKHTGWWQTLPGILTAIAGVLTAVGSLVLALHQAGFFERDDSKAVESTRPPVVSASANQREGQASSSQSASSMKPWPQTQAKITARDGSIAIVRADTLSNCISASHELTLLGGQEVQFEQMKGFEVLRADAAGTPSAKAEIVITLVDGKVIKDQVAADCDVFGYNDVGRFTTYFQKIQRVEFQR